MKRKPLMMMRTRGLSGSFFRNHFGIPGLSKSIGAAFSPGGALSAAVVEALMGWTGSEGCVLEDGSTTTVKFTKDVTYEGDYPTGLGQVEGVKFFNTTRPGAELNPDIGFVDGTGWVLSGSATITGGFLTLPNFTNATFALAGLLDVGGLYEYEFECTEHAGGVISVSLGSTSIPVDRVGTYTGTIFVDGWGIEGGAVNNFTGAGQYAFSLISFNLIGELPTSILHSTNMSTPSDIIEYDVTWALSPIQGDAVIFSYNSGYEIGDYADASIAFDEVAPLDFTDSVNDFWTGTATGATTFDTPSGSEGMHTKVSGDELIVRGRTYTITVTGMSADLRINTRDDNVGQGIERLAVDGTYVWNVPLGATDPNVYVRAVAAGSHSVATLTITADSLMEEGTLTLVNCLGGFLAWELEGGGNLELESCSGVWELES